MKDLWSAAKTIGTIMAAIFVVCLMVLLPVWAATELLTFLGMNVFNC